MPDIYEYADAVRTIKIILNVFGLTLDSISEDDLTKRYPLTSYNDLQTINMFLDTSKLVGRVVSEDRWTWFEFTDEAREFISLYKL